MSCNYKIYKISFAPLIMLLFLMLIPLITSLYLFEGIDLKFKNRGNCYLIDNQYVNKFDLNRITSNITLESQDELNQPINEKIFIKFCSIESPSIKNHTSLVKIIINENEIDTWYNYSFDSKVWDYDSNSKTLKIKMLTDRKCKLANNEYKNNYKNKNFDKPKLESEGLKLVISLNIHCNNSLSETQSIISSDSKLKLNRFIKNELECNKILNFESKFVCPLNSRINLYRFYSEYSFIFGMFHIILGFFMLTYGNLFELITYYLNGILFSRMLISYMEDFVLYCFIQFEKDYAEYVWLLWLFEVFSILIGFMIGYYIKNFREAKILFLGSMTGHVIFYLVWLPLCFFVRYNPSVFYYFFHIISFVLTGIISLRYFAKSKNFLIISCAVIGSYNAVKVN
jgi:hypothetical protein